MKSAALIAVPPGVVTAMSTPPAVWAGVTTVMVVSLTTVKVAAMPPIVTALAPVKLLPVIVTVVPPSVVPLVGPKDMTAGGGITYV